MALRYFQQQEQSYVPTYTPLNAEILSNTHQQIQAQGAKARQYKRDTFDVAAENVTSTLSSLGAKEQQYAREQFAQSRKNLRQIMEEQGARNAMPFIDEEVNRISSELRPLTTAAESYAEQLKQLEDSKAGPGIISHIKRQQPEGEFDDQGDLITVKGGLQGWEIQTAKNWKELDKGLIKFTNDWKADRISQDRYTTTGYLVTDESEQVSFDEVSEAAQQYLLNDPQYSAQLQLMAEKQLEQTLPKNSDGSYDDSMVNLNVIEDEAGNPTKIQTTLEKKQFNDDGTLKRDEQGNPLTEKFTKTFNSLAKWQAFKQAQPFAQKESYMDTGFSIKESPETETTDSSSEEQGNPYFSGPFSVTEEETTYRKQFKDQMKNITENEGVRYQSALSDIESAASTALNKGSNLRVNYNPDENKVTVTQRYQQTDANGDPILDSNGNPVWKRREVQEEDFKSDSARKYFEDKKDNIINQHRKMMQTKRQFSSIRKAATQNIKSQYPDMAEHINLAENGDITFKDSLDYEQLIRDLGTDNRWWNSASYDGPEEVRPGEIKRSTIRERVGTIQGEPQYREKEVLLYNKDGNERYINFDEGRILSDIQQSTDKFLNKFTNEMFGKDQTKQYNVAPINNDPKSGTIDDNILNLFNEPLPQLAGTFKLANNPDEEMNPTPSAFFDPYGVFFRDGNPVVAGTYYDEGRGEDTSELEGGKRVFWEGNLAESIGSRQLPDKYVIAAFDQQFRNAFSPIVHEGKQSATLGSDDLDQMGIPTGEGGLDKVKINHSNRWVDTPNSETGERRQTFEVEVYPEGQDSPELIYGDTITDIQDQLLNYMRGGQTKTQRQPVNP